MRILKRLECSYIRTADSVRAGKTSRITTNICIVCSNFFQELSASPLWCSWIFFYQFRLRMKHHEQVNFNAPPHSEANFCYEPGLVCREPVWQKFKPRFSQLLTQFSATDPSCYPSMKWSSYHSLHPVLLCEVPCGLCFIHTDLIPVTFSEMFDLKAKYDESDNIAVRMTRTLTDKVGQLFGELESELSPPPRRI